jgi:hypothetical protein
VVGMRIKYQCCSDARLAEHLDSSP